VFVANFEARFLRYLLAQVQYYSSVREVGDLAFCTPRRTTARRDSDNGLTTVSTITYACCNTHSHYNAALAALASAPITCDVTPTVWDTAKTRMDTAQKRPIPFKILQKIATRPPRRFDVTLRPTITYSVDYEEDTEYIRVAIPLVQRAPPRFYKGFSAWDNVSGCESVCDSVQAIYTAR
jgi:hypothetical protein